MNFPRTIADRCVHSLIETASCSACVDACPRNAWILDDDALGLDLDACDGCGLCRPECPEGAIDINLPVASRTLHGQKIAIAICEYSGANNAEMMLPCVHALGLQEILRLYDRGIMRLVTVMGVCDECRRGERRTLAQRIEPLNRSLRQSGAPPFLLEQQSVEEWTENQTRMDEIAAGPLVSRRGFLRSFIDTESTGVGNIALFLGGEGELFEPLGELLPNLTDGSLLPSIPEIEPQRCNGCDACIRICPHQALRLEQTDDGPAYQLYASRCTGCSVCVDVCEQDAVLIQHWNVQQHQQLPLRQMICRSCGVPFHLPAQQEEEEGALCRICSRNDHQKNLYQIL